MQFQFLKAISVGSLILLVTACQSVGTESEVDVSDSNIQSSTSPGTSLESPTNKAVTGKQTNKSGIETNEAERLSAFRYFVGRYTESMRAGDRKKAHFNIKMATETGIGGGKPWLVRTYAAQEVEDYGDIIYSLAKIAERYPEILSDFDPKYLNYLLRLVSREDQLRTEFMGLLEGLFLSDWKGEYGEPYYYWRTLLFWSLDNGKDDLAVQLARRIDDPIIIASILADKRSDPLIKYVPEILNTEEVAKSYRDKLYDKYRNNEKSMRLIVQLTYALITTQEYAEIIDITEPVWTAFNEESLSTMGYLDVEDNLVWVLNNRAIAYEAIGIPDRSIDILKVASTISEREKGNVSQVINLAVTLCNYGRTDEAEGVLGRVGKSISPYGLMQVKSAELCIAIRRDMKNKVNEVLDYMYEHKEDAYSTYMSAQLRTQPLEVAAQAFVSWVGNPDTRQDALLYVQSFAEPPNMPPYDEQMIKLVGKLIENPKTKKAIKQYGHIKTYNFRSIF